MKIKNFKQLAKTHKRRVILQILETGLKAIDTYKLTHQSIIFQKNILQIQSKKFSLKKVKNIWLAGVGKCSLEAARAIKDILGAKISGGVIIDLKRGRLKGVKTYVADHPLPSPRNVKSAAALINLLEKAGEEDLVILIISGGGSTLLCQPQTMSCYQESSIIQCLIKAGAAIQEINTLRKHLSLARGGFLAKYAQPARLLSLIYSDVPGDDLSFVASGPTIKDKTTVHDALRILKKYKVWKRCGFDPILIETPKEKKYFKQVNNFLMVSNRSALEAMAFYAKKKGLKPKICTSCLMGEARDVGRAIIQKLHRAKPKTILLYGGETTVTVKGKGRGGRNQELVLSALQNLKSGEIIASFASDGQDNGKFAGAIGDQLTLEEARKKKLSIKKYLKDNNSYEFFSQVGDYLLTGQTGANVSDLVLALSSEI